jgi:hypothetical protein
VALKPTSTRRCGLKLQLVWKCVNARPATCLDLEFVCGLPGLQGADNVAFVRHQGARSGWSTTRRTASSKRWRATTGSSSHSSSEWLPCAAPPLATMPVLRRRLLPLPCHRALTSPLLRCRASPRSDASPPHSNVAPRVASHPTDARPRPPPAALPGLAPPHLNCIGGEKRGRGRGRERKEEKKEATRREKRRKRRKKKEEKKREEKENKLFICRKYD